MLTTVSGPGSCPWYFCLYVNHLLILTTVCWPTSNQIGDLIAWIFILTSAIYAEKDKLIPFCLTLKVPVTAIDALRHFETG